MDRGTREIAGARTALAAVTILALAVGSAALSGCGETKQSSPIVQPGGHNALMEAAVSQEHPPDPSKWPHALFVQQPGTLARDRIPQAWRAYDVRRSSTSFPIVFETGCGERNIAYVDERTDRVVIDVWLEPAKLDEGEGCIASAWLGRAEVRLSRPLGQRRLLTHAARPLISGQTTPTTSHR